MPCTDQIRPSTGRFVPFKILTPARNATTLDEMKAFEIVGLPPDELNAFLSATHPDPFRILGPHRVGDDLAIRIFRPDAQKVEVVVNGSGAAVEAERIHRDGFFCARIPNATRDLD